MQVWCPFKKCSNNRDGDCTAEELEMRVCIMIIDILHIVEFMSLNILHTKRDDMTIDKFNDYFQLLVKEEQELLDKKGQEYSGKENRFRNFQDLGKELDMDQMKILWIYFSKHLDSIRSYLRGEYRGSEPIRGRIQDARNYLALLGGMIEEEEENQPVVT